MELKKIKDCWLKNEGLRYLVYSIAGFFSLMLILHLLTYYLTEPYVETFVC